MGNLRDYIRILESGSRDKGGAIDFGIPSLGAEHLDNNGKLILGKKMKYISYDHYKQMRTGKIQKGDVLVVKDGATTGKTSFVNSDFPYSKAAINEHVFLLRPKNMLLPKFLFYYLYSECGQRLILQDFRGATVGGISRDFIDIPIKLPPMDVQQKIADVLDKASALIELRRTQLEKLDLLIKSQFIEMFGDPVTNPMRLPERTFSDITSSRLGKMLDGKQQTGKCRYPYLANYNVQWFYFDLSKMNEMDFDAADRQEFQLKDGDLLVCEGGEVGRCAIWRNEIDNCFFQKAVHRVRCDLNFILPEYLAWWFKLRSDYNGFEDIVGSKSTIAHLPGAKLKILQVVVPPVGLQKQFATILQQVDQSKLAIQQSLSQLERNYKSLMQKCFRGELF